MEHKYITDYGILMELFMDVMCQHDKELHHKRFMRKIYSKLHKVHKHRKHMCSVSESRVKIAVGKAEKDLAELPSEISLGVLVCLVYTRHNELLKLYQFDLIDFNMMSRYSGASGVIMQTAKVLNKIEENMYD